MADKTFKKGDRVEWNSHGSTAVGTVERKITSETEAAGRTVVASEEEPQYLVRSEKSGGTAVHKPGALTRKMSRAPRPERRLPAWRTSYNFHTSQARSSRFSTSF